MDFITALEQLPENERQNALADIVEKGAKTDFGQWVLLVIEEQIGQVKNSLLMCNEQTESWRLTIILQTLERMKANILVTKEDKQDAGTSRPESDT
jgi:hypothetical protein